jgi:hypothetical protein
LNGQTEYRSARCRGPELGSFVQDDAAACSATLVALALLAAVVGISAGVGFAARGEGFDWGVASIFGTALGTTLLAVSTLALAYSTWQDVRASQQIAEVTGRSLNLAEAEREERLRPAVLGTVREVNLHPPPDVRPFMDILLHNVGGGVAVRVEVVAEYAGGGVAVEAKTLPVLLPGTSFAIGLDFDADVVEGEFGPEDFRVRGHYRDRLGRVQPPIVDWQYDELESGI